MGLSAETSFPSCEEARSSQQLKNETLVRILAEIGNLKVRADVLLEQSTDLMNKIRSGQLEKSVGGPQVRANAAETAQLVERSHQLRALSACISK